MGRHKGLTNKFIALALVFILVTVTPLCIFVPFASPSHQARAADGLLGIPQEEWSKTFGSSALDRAMSVEQTSDGGYIMAGLTMSYGAGGEDVWLIKTDSDGNEQWNKTFGGSGADNGNSIQQTSDGGYIIAGVTMSYGAGSWDVWLIRTDANGNQLWNKTFGGSSMDWGNFVRQTPDGGYIITGWTCSYGAGDYDVWLIKIDANGSELWNKTFGGSYRDDGFAVQQTSDGGYIIAGYAGSYGAGERDVWLIKTDADGSELWNKTFGGTSRDMGYSMQQTSDGGYIIAGVTMSYGAGERDVWLIRTDANGNELWNKTFGGSAPDGASSVKQTTDGGYIIAGGTCSYGAGDCDVWLIKTDANGSELWNKTFGGSRGDDPRSVEQTSDGGYIVAGLTMSYGAGGEDVWLIKVGVEETKTWYVDDDLQDYPAADFTKIQDAVNAANPGDTIIVYPGTYTENVKVNKDHLTIQSENGAEKTFVQARDPNYEVFEVVANYVTIKGFTISKGWLGFWLGYVHNNVLANNIIIENKEDGIRLAGSDNNILSGNIISNNLMGIHLEDSDNNTLTNNTNVGNYHSGIFLFRSGYNTIRGTTSKFNNVGISFWESSNNTIYLNNFGENTGGNVGYYDSSTNVNTWNSPGKITYTHNGKTYVNYLGNYWSDYSGSDADGDGIGDTPYSIDSDKDNYPLIEPFENYEIGPAPAPAYLVVNITEPEDGAEFSTCVYFNLVFTITNRGGADAELVAATITPSANVAVDAFPPGAPWTKGNLGTISAGGNITNITVEMHCVGPGPSMIHVVPAGWDASSGQEIPPANLVTDIVTVHQWPWPQLEVHITTPSDGATFSVCQVFEVTAEVENIGDATAVDVTVTISITGPASTIDPFTRPTIPSDILSGSAATVSWNVHCDGAGDVVIEISDVSGIDENTGLAIPDENIELPCSIVIHQKTEAPPTPPDYFSEDWVEKVINWASKQEQEGKDYWKEYCMAFVSDAFKVCENRPASPNELRNNLENVGKFYSKENNWDPPRGSLVFFSATGKYAPYGHIGISIGGRKVIHAYQTVREETIADIESLSYIDCYLGWAYPPEEFFSPEFSNTFKIGDTFYKKEGWNIRDIPSCYGEIIPNSGEISGEGEITEESPNTTDINGVCNGGNCGSHYWWHIKIGDEEGWCAEEGLDQPPVCAVELRKDGVEIDGIDVGDFFDIYVGNATDDVGIKEVRFSSDASQDGTADGEWTDWCNWDTSSGDWDAETKIKKWSFATGGAREVWAEVKDGVGQTDRCSANIYVHPGYAIVVAGQAGWPEKRGIDHSANNAYKVLRNLGFDDNHIYYLNSNQPQNPDNDPEDEVDAFALLSDFENAMMEVRDKMGDSPTPFILYLVGHGSRGEDDPELYFFEFVKDGEGEEGPLYSGELNFLLSLLPEETPMLIVIGSCYSGGFVTSDNGISAENRIIITAAHDDWLFGDILWFDSVWFSDRFWGNLNKGLDVKEAFIKDATASDVTYRWLDDNGDRQGHPPYFLGDDGELAAATTIGVPGTECLELTDWYLVWKRSPGELRVYDSQNRVTGLVNGEVKEEIPGSIYDEENEIVAIFSPSDTYRYEVVGTDEETYGLDIASIEDGEATTFAATDIPTSANATHDYVIDWDALSQGEEGVTVQIDSEGDGTFEKTISADNELTHDEFMLQTATIVDFDPDTLNLRSKREFVTVYIELPPGYDVSEIDISSITLDGVVPALAKPTEMGDYDGDDTPDLMVKFDGVAVQDILTVGEQVEITITGEVAGIAFEGSDTIRVIDE